MKRLKSITFDVQFDGYPSIKYKTSLYACPENILRYCVIGIGTDRLNTIINLGNLRPMDYETSTI